MHAKSTQQIRESASVSNCTKILCVWNVGEPRIRKLSAYEIFWIYSSMNALCFEFVCIFESRKQKKRAQIYRRGESSSEQQVEPREYAVWKSFFWQRQGLHVSVAKKPGWLRLAEHYIFLNGIEKNQKIKGKMYIYCIMLYTEWIPLKYLDKSVGKWYAHFGLESPLSPSASVAEWSGSAVIAYAEASARSPHLELIGSSM